MIQASAILTTLLLLTACGDAPPPATPSAPPPDGPYVLVLGNAQDAGFPQIGSRHARARAAWRDASLRRATASLLIADPGSGNRWLVDATPQLPEQVAFAEGHPPSRASPEARPPLFEGIFLTHAHMGHYAGLLHLGREAYAAQEMPVHGSQRMVAFLAKNAPWELLVRLGHVRLNELQADREVTLAPGLSLMPFLVPHRAEYTDTLGFLIQGPRRKLLYIPDIDKWERWDRRIEDLVAACDVALLDGTFYADGEIPGRSMAEIPHPFIVESMKRFSALPARERRKIRFIHLNHTNPAIDARSPERAIIQAGGHDVAEPGEIHAL